MEPEKYRFLPKAHNYHGYGEEEAPPPEPSPAVLPGQYPCPCCGYLTLPVPREAAIAYICPVCYWENDVFDPEEDAPSDENHGMTLRQGRENFGKYGAAEPRFLECVRPPLPAEYSKKEETP